MSYSNDISRKSKDMFGKSKTVLEKAKPNNLQARIDNMLRPSERDIPQSVLNP
jgi:hypothetical protein